MDWPRRPSSTILIFSSAEYCFRVARRMSFTTCSLEPTCVTDFCLIFVLHTITMNQKFSVVQVMHSVQLGLNPDTAELLDRSALRKIQPSDLCNCFHNKHSKKGLDSWKHNGPIRYRVSFACRFTNQYYMLLRENIPDNMITALLLWHCWQSRWLHIASRIWGG